MRSSFRENLFVLHDDATRQISRRGDLRSSSLDESLNVAIERQKQSRNDSNTKNAAFPINGTETFARP